MASKETEQENTANDSNVDTGFLKQIPFFNRIKQFASKSKDDLVTNNNLSFGLTEIASYGFPGVITQVSYDPVQKLLAIGTSTGSLVILGNNGLALRLRISQSPIKLVCFLSNLPIVIAVNQNNQFFSVDIANITINEIHKTLDEVTTLEIYPDTKWILFGTDLGGVYVLDIVCGYLSNYTPPKLKSAVKFLKVSPVNCNHLLVGCEGGEITLLNIKTAKPLKVFELNSKYELETPTKLTALTWSPGGTHLVSGYENGWIVFWSINENFPVWTRTAALENLDISLELALPENRASIFGLEWCAHSGTEESTLCVLGGDEEDSNSHVRLIRLQSCLLFNEQLSELAIPLPSPRSSQVCIFPAESPWGSKSKDPIALLVISGGVVVSFNLQGESLELPVLLQWLGCDIIHSKLFSECPSILHNAIIAHENSLVGTDFKPQLPLEGGLIQPRQVDHFFYELILTSHSDGSIKVWDSSSNILSPLTHLTVWPTKLEGYENKKPIALDLNVTLGNMIICFSDSTILVYNFCQQPKCLTHSSKPNSSISANSIGSGDSNYNSQNHSNKAISRSSTNSDSLPSPEAPSNSTENEIQLNCFVTQDDKLRIIFPSFEVLGHKGKLVALSSKLDFMVASDDSGGISIINVLDRHIIYYENDITSVSGRFGSTSLAHFSTTPQETVFISKLDISFDESSGYLKILGVSNDGDVYLYLVQRSETGYNIFKSKMYSGSESEKKNVYIAFYSNEMPNYDSQIPLREDSKSLEPVENNNTEEMKTNQQSKEKDGLSEEATVHKTKSWLNIKDMSANATNRLTKSLSINPLTKKDSKDSVKISSMGKDSSDEAAPGSPEIKDNSSDRRSLLSAGSKHNSLLRSATSSSRKDNSKAKAIPKNLITSSHFSVICTETTISLHKHSNKKIERQVSIDPARGVLIKARLIRFNELDVLVCLTSLGFVDVYGVSSLKQLYQAVKPLSKTYNIDQCTITHDGRIVVNIDKFELKQFCLTENHDAMSSPLCSKVQLYDPFKRVGEQPYPEVPWYNLALGGVHQDSVVKIFDKGRPSNFVPLDRTRSNQNVNIQTYSDACHTSPSVCATHTLGYSSAVNSPTSVNKGSNNLTAITSPEKPLESQQGKDPKTPALPNGTEPKKPSGLAAMLANATNQLQERGEKLDQISDHTRAVAESSEDFLSEIKAYNERQKNKKWYHI